MLYFSIQNRLQDRTSKVSEAAGARWRFLSSDYRRLSSNRLSIGGSTSGSFRSNLELQDLVAGAVLGEFPGWLYLLQMTFHMSCGSMMKFILRARRSTWFVSRVSLLAPRIVNEVIYVMRITDDVTFAWQAQYLVKLEGDSCCSAHCKCRFIFHADQWWVSFCVAGAVFGEVGVWLFCGRRSTSWHFGR